VYTVIAVDTCGHAGTACWNRTRGKGTRMIEEAKVDKGIYDKSKEEKL